MASSDMSLASEHVQRLLQCAVCLERFKQPKLLPCQHTFCLRPCLEGLVDHRTRSIRCPECRADHFVPRNGVSSYPNNLTVIGFLELSEPLARTPEETPPWRACVEFHPPQPQRAASPPGAPINAAGAEGGGCFVCHNEGRIVRCDHCDYLVCDDCHRVHTEQVKSELTRLISQVRRGLPHITEQIVVLGRKGNRLQNNCEHVRAEVTDAMEKHIRELRVRERTLREDIDNFLAGELRAIRTHEENAEMHIASLASFCDSAESFLSMNRSIPNGELMEMKRQCEEHLETVISYEDGTIQPPSVKQLQASLESPFLTSTISNFGDLIITSRANYPVRLPPGEDSITDNIRSQARASMPPQGEEDDDELAVRGIYRQPQTSIPPQREDNSMVSPRAHVSVSRTLRAGPSASQGSPRERRRQVGILRVPQVIFAEETPQREDVSNQRTFAGGHNISGHRNRRTREERRSDSYLSAMIGARILAQQSIDRTRHLSLGALPVATENSEDENSEREPGQSLAETQDENNGSENFVELSSTFPGARPRDTFPPPVRFDLCLNNTEHQGADISRLHDPSNSPSMYVSSPRNKYNQKGTVLIGFGHRGSGTKCFTWPRGVAVSPLTDNILVADSSNHRVQVFDNNGRFLKTFGQYGQGEGEFDCLAGIAVTGLGQIIVADRYNHRIQVLDRSGAFNNSFGTEGSGLGQLNFPWGVACDSMGFIYVCDKENHRIQVFQSNGTFVRTFGLLGNRDGQFENPHYVAISADNKVYVSDSSNHRIQVFSMYGDYLFSFGSAGTLRGQMKFPRGIAIDDQGFVVVADSGNNRVQVFRGDGRFYTMFGNWGSESGNFKGLEGVAILANGNIVVCDRENHRIQIF